jgi:hypothetical protein
MRNKDIGHKGRIRVEEQRQDLHQPQRIRFVR